MMVLIFLKQWGVVLRGFGNWEGFLRILLIRVYGLS